MTTTQEDHMASIPINRLDDVRAAHNVVSAVRNAEAARGVIEALERHGVEGAHIALLGSRDPDVRPNPLRWVVGRVGRLFLAGLFLGAFAGATVGWMTSVEGWAGRLFWPVFGGLVGAFAVAVSSFGVSRAWWRTFEAESAGTLAVGVHTDDRAEAELAAQVLEAARPMSMNRF
jgi:hypothetical protein